MKSLKNPRNVSRPLPPLPNGWRPIAVVYGTGKDDYLVKVLAFNPDNLGGTYCVWTGNCDKGCEGYGDGDYFSAMAFAIHGGDEEEPDIPLRRAFDAAWHRFVERALPMAEKSSTWQYFDVEV